MTHTPEEVERKYKQWFALALPGRHYRCFLCGKMTGKANTTGYLPGLGPVMKCPACRGAYVEIVRSLGGGER